MSRGYGYVQRVVLEELDEGLVAGDPWVDAEAIAERLDGAQPTRPMCRSVRRALRLLAAEGFVELSLVAPTRAGERLCVRARIAESRADDVARRCARRAQARALRVELGLALPDRQA